MGDDAEKLTGYEDRERPRARPHGQGAEERQRVIMLLELLPMGVDEDVGIDSDQGLRSIWRNKASRSLTSTLGSARPLTVGHSNLSGCERCGDARALRKASSTILVNVVFIQLTMSTLPYMPTSLDALRSDR